jgi:hypothetical protein
MNREIDNAIEFQTTRGLPPQKKIPFGYRWKHIGIVSGHIPVYLGNSRIGDESVILHSWALIADNEPAIQQAQYLRAAAFVFDLPERPKNPNIDLADCKGKKYRYTQFSKGTSLYYEWQEVTEDEFDKAILALAVYNIIPTADDLGE